MTAPTRASSRDARAHTATRVKPPGERSNTKPGSTRERPAPGRSRSTAAKRAYARRAQRTKKVIGTAGERTSQPPVRASRAPFVVLVMGLLVVGVATTLWLSTQATADSYRLEQAKQQATTLAEQVEQLQADVAHEQSPGELADKARALGMVPASDPAHLVLDSNGKVRVVGQPEVAQRPTPSPTSPPAPQPARQRDDQRARSDAQYQGVQHRAGQHQAAQHRTGGERATGHRTPAERTTNGGD